MRKDVTEHLRKCEACQQWSRWPKSNELRPTWVVEPFDLLYLDWIIDLPMTSSRKSCIITCTDALTKWTETQATIRATALESTKFLVEQVIFRFGVPVAVATDNGTRGGQTFPKSTEIRNSVAFHAVFSGFFRLNFSVWQNRFPSSFCSSHDVLTYWEANSG